MDKLTLKKLYNTEFPELYGRVTDRCRVIWYRTRKNIIYRIFDQLEDKNLKKVGYRLFCRIAK